jgi:hypothetical protein
MTDLERMHQLIQHDTAPPPPIPTPEATAKPTFYGRDWMRNAGETGTGFDMTKGGNAMSGAAQQALDAGHKVELVADGGNKTVPIVGVKNGMMVDDKGQQWGGVPVAFDGTGREGLRITPSATPKGPEPWETAPEYGPQPAPAQSQTTGGGARTAADAKDVAKTHYDYADSVGGTLTPQFTNKFIDSVAAAAPQTEAGAAVSGKSAVADLTERLQSLRGKPMTLQAVQEVDEGLSGLIDKEYGTKGLSKEGKHLLDVQADFRNMIEDAGAGDITGDASGFDALKSGRQAWSQARKMDDVERMWQRANGTDNPTTDFRRQVRVLLDNRARSRGYTATEKASLWDAASRGVIGGTLHVFGSRLIPWAAGIAETKSGGLGSGLLAAGVAHAGTTAIRGAGNWLQQRRINRTMEGLGASVPPPAPPLP